MRDLAFASVSLAYDHVPAVTNLQGDHTDLQAGHTDLQVGYNELHDVDDDDACISHGCTLLQVGGLEALERWDAARRRHHAYGSRAKPGYAEGTAQALAAAQGQTLVCMEPCCGALVHLQAARRQARAAGRSTFVVGDGCASNCERSAHFATLGIPLAPRLDGERI